MKKGKKKNQDRRLMLLESLGKYFPLHNHLLTEFLIVNRLHVDSDLWVQYTEAGLVRLFEGFLSLTVGPSLEKRDGEIIAIIVSRLESIHKQIILGANVNIYRSELKYDIIIPLEDLYQEWLKR